MGNWDLAALGRVAPREHDQEGQHGILKSNPDHSTMDVGILGLNPPGHGRSTHICSTKQDSSLLTALLPTLVDSLDPE